MDIVTLCGFGILAAVLCAVVRQIRPDSALGISVAAGVIILAAAVSLLAPAVEAFTAVSDAAGISGEYVTVLLKALSVCYITTLSADCARDAGEAALGGKLEFAGRAAVAVISLPVFTSLANLVTQLIQ